MIHTFICDTCGLGIQDTDTHITHFCPKCGEGMRWDLCKNVSGRSDYRHISDSLAIHPDDSAEHRARFPGVELTPEGQPCFTSVKQQERYAARCGFYKRPQRTHKLGRKRIA